MTDVATLAKAIAHLGDFARRYTTATKWIREAISAPPTSILFWLLPSVSCGVASA